MSLRIWLAAFAAFAAAVALGLMLPVPHKADAEAKSQFATLELGG